MEFIDFKAFEESRIHKLKVDIAKIYPALLDVLEHFPEAETVRTLATLLANQFRRLEEIESMPFDDRPAHLVGIEEQSGISLLGGLIKELETISGNLETIFPA
jgi:hypothetical protein